MNADDTCGDKITSAARFARPAPRAQLPKIPLQQKHDSGLECVSGDVRMLKSPPQLQIQIWPIDRLIFYARNPRKNDSTVDRMCSSIREFGFKIPVLARSDGEVVDGHLCL